MAKILVVYYSRTGFTRTVGQAIAHALGADSEEIIDLADRKGVRGFFSAGKEAYAKVPARIMAAQKDPACYDLVIIGTPVWAFTMACAPRAYIETYKKKITSAAFFCTTGGAAGEKTLRQMEELSGVRSRAGLVLTSKEIVKGDWQGKIDVFVKALRSS